MTSAPAVPQSSPQQLNSLSVSKQLLFLPSTNNDISLQDEVCITILETEQERPRAQHLPASKHETEVNHMCNYITDHHFQPS